jgi:hypothetical protein
MQQLSASPATTMSAQESSGAPNTPLQGRWLLSARASWTIVTLNVVLLPSYNAALQAHCQPGALCLGLQLTAYGLLVL